jgi:hypothetical protein
VIAYQTGYSVPMARLDRDDRISDGPAVSAPSVSPLTPDWDWPRSAAAPRSTLASTPPT